MAVAGQQESEEGCIPVMSVAVTVQPTVTTSASIQCTTTVDPPSLVIDDGTTTFVLRPAEDAGGVAVATEFAHKLAQVASEWESSCRRALAATQPEHHFDADVIDTGHGTAPGDDAPGLDSSYARSPLTMNGSVVTIGSAPKSVKRTGLIAARKAAGFTQEELAARLGVERSTVYRWESGETVPLPLLRPGLARLLRVDGDRLSVLLGESS